MERFEPKCRMCEETLSDAADDLLLCPKCRQYILQRYSAKNPRDVILRRSKHVALGMRLQKLFGHNETLMQAAFNWLNEEEDAAEKRPDVLPGQTDLITLTSRPEDKQEENTQRQASARCRFCTEPLNEFLQLHYSTDQRESYQSDRIMLGSPVNLCRRHADVIHHLTVATNDDSFTLAVSISMIAYSMRLRSQNEPNEMRHIVQSFRHITESIAALHDANDCAKRSAYPFELDYGLCHICHNEIECHDEDEDEKRERHGFIMPIMYRRTEDLPNRIKAAPFIRAHKNCAQSFVQTELQSNSAAPVIQRALSIIPLVKRTLRALNEGSDPTLFLANVFKACDPRNNIFNPFGFEADQLNNETPLRFTDM